MTNFAQNAHSVLTNEKLLQRLEENPLSVAPEMIENLTCSIDKFDEFYTRQFGAFAIARLNFKSLEEFFAEFRQDFTLLKPHDGSEVLKMTSKPLQCIGVTFLFLFPALGYVVPQEEG